MTTGPTRPVAVGVDGTDACTAAITWGARLAAAESRPLLLVHGGARLLQDVSGDPGAARANAVLASRHAAHHARSGARAPGCEGTRERRGASIAACAGGEGSSTDQREISRSSGSVSRKRRPSPFEACFARTSG